MLATSVFRPCFESPTVLSMRGRSGSYQLYQARWKNTATDEICLRRSFLIEAMLENLGTPLWQVTMKSSFWLRGFYRQQDPDLCGVCRCPKNFPRMARLEVSGWNDSGLVQQLKNPKKIAFWSKVSLVGCEDCEDRVFMSMGIQMISDALSALSHSKVGVFNHMILDELQQPHCDVSGMMVHEGNHL